MKASTPLVLCLALLLAGCGTTPKATPEQVRADNPAKAELSDKLEQMSPEERSAYVQSHQAEIQKTYSGVDNSQPSGK